MPKRDNNSSSREGRRKAVVIALCAVAALYLVASFIFGEMGVVKYDRMRLQYQSLTMDIDQLKQDNEKLAREVRMLKTDPACIERLARDKLGLARPGEIVDYYKAN